MVNMSYDWSNNRPTSETCHSSFMHWSSFMESKLEWYKPARPLNCAGQFVMVGCFKGTVTASGAPTVSTESGISWQSTGVALTGTFYNECNLDPRLINLQKGDIFKGYFNGICDQTIVICTVSMVGVCMVVAEGTHKLSL